MMKQSWSALECIETLNRLLLEHSIFLRLINDLKVCQKEQLENFNFKKYLVREIILAVRALLPKEKAKQNEDFKSIEPNGPVKLDHSNNTYFFY